MKIVILLLMICVELCSSENWRGYFEYCNSVTQLGEILDREFGADSNVIIKTFGKMVVGDKSIRDTEDSETLRMAVAYIELRILHKGARNRFYNDMVNNAVIDDKQKGKLEDFYGVLMAYGAYHNNGAFGGYFFDVNKRSEYFVKPVSPITTLDLPEDNSKKSE
jgi:hypothetical protein